MILPVAGVLLALGSAVAWGGADFFGGLASRRRSYVEVLALSRLSLIGVLCSLAILLKDPIPPIQSIAFAVLAGVSGASGIASLYKGLAVGRSAFVVPTAGVVGAALPVVFVLIVEGVLPVVQQVGLVVALIGIWLVSMDNHGKGGDALGGIKYGFGAGLGFGGSFILLGQVETGFVFTPLAIAGTSGSLVAAVVLVVSRAGLPNPAHNPVALVAGTLDAAGIVCYMLAIRLMRLDLVVVLGALYPAVAVLLFRAVLKERVSGIQWVGLAVCVFAMGLIVT